MARAQLITGPPGVGKTSLLLSLLEMLPGTKGGFTTREIREGGERVGFQITDLSGREGVLAHVRRPGPPRVGRYGVDLKTFEAIGVHPLLGTIVAKAHPVADRIKARPDVQVQRLTPTNSKEVVRAVTADLGWWLASTRIPC